MWCADCEAIDKYFFPKTRFFFFVPTLETTEKLSKLFESLEFDYLQGYYFGKPELKGSVVR